MSLNLPQGMQINAPLQPGYENILTLEALEFVAKLHRAFEPRLPDSVGFGHHFAHGAGIRGFGARLRRLLEGRTLVSLETWLEPRMEARPEPRREEKQELQRESWSASRFEPADAVPNRTFRAPDRRDSPYPPGGAKGTLIP